MARSPIEPPITDCGREVSVKSSGRFSRSVRAGIIACGTLLVSGTVLAAHDFWLVPVDLRVEPGAWIEVHGQTSSRFPTSESAVALDRIADARVISASGESRIADLSHAGTSLVLRDRPTTSGQRVVAARLKWRSVRESAEGFRRYLQLEGAGAALAELERQGRLPTDSITRRYAKYAKAIVQVGRGGSRAYSRVAGHALEFVPLVDPATLRPGDTLAVRLLYDGKPLARAHVHAGAAPRAAEAAPEDLSLDTDAQGVVRIPVTQEGLWNVRTIHIVPSPRGSGADWDTHWASLVFGVGRGNGRGAAARAGIGEDSAAVAAVVQRYHAALAAGDSAAALSLLSPHAVILESGGIETRDEYRSHHLPGDIAFARSVRSERGPIRVRVQGDVAWASSTSTTQGTYRERPVDSLGAELMVLERTVEGWKISAVHWSSRARRR